MFIQDLSTVFIVQPEIQQNQTEFSDFLCTSTLCTLVILRRTIPSFRDVGRDFLCLCTSDSYGRGHHVLSDIFRKLWQNFFKLGTNVHWDSRRNWLDFDSPRSRPLWPHVCPKVVNTNYAGTPGGKFCGTNNHLDSKMNWLTRFRPSKFKLQGQCDLGHLSHSCEQRYLRNPWRESYFIWHKCPLGVRH